MIITFGIILNIINVIGDIMKELIKQIRQFTGLSQNEMANKVGVSFATINRWENGHSLPTRLAQDKLYELCDAYAVPIYEMIIKKIKKEVNALTVEKNRVILYHGSKNGLVGKIAPISRERCDFGKGFYLGENFEQASTYIANSSSKYVYSFSLKEKNLLIEKFNVNTEWMLAIAYYRGWLTQYKSNELINNVIKALLIPNSSTL